MSGNEDSKFGMMPLPPEINPEVEQTDEGLSQNENPLDINNPTLLTIIPKNVALESILKRLEKGRINFITDYQRKDNLWDNKKKSGLIESILLKIPIPSFYFDVSNEHKWDIVDGLQRLSTIKHFVLDENPLVLEGLEVAKELNGKSFKDLDYSFQERIREYELSTFQILPGAPDQLKFELFKRLNTGGLALTPQEIRHALNQPIASLFVKNCAELNEFKRAFEWKLKNDRMEDRDYVNRFFAFYLLKDIKDYKPDLDSFMNSAMKVLNKKDLHELSELKNIFGATMKNCYEIFGSFTFRKVTHDDFNRKQINKALYEAVSVNVAKSIPKTISNLKKNKTEVLNKLRDLHEDSTFFSSLTSGTSDTSKVIYRNQKIKELFNNFADD
jgi:hypothetical protein